MTDIKKGIPLHKNVAPKRRSESPGNWLAEIHLKETFIVKVSSKCQHHDGANCRAVKHDGS